MSHRAARVSAIVRDVVSDALAHRIWDPRVSRFTSVTRVEVSGDLRYADVHVSVMGTENEGQTTMKGLESARGMIQGRLARQLDIRHCPLLRFHLDRGLKAAIQTIQQIDEARAEDAKGAENRGPDPKAPQARPQEGGASESPIAE